MKSDTQHVCVCFFPVTQMTAQRACFPSERSKCQCITPARMLTTSLTVPTLIRTDKQSNELSSNQAPRTSGCAACRGHRDKKCHFKKMILKHRNPKCSQIRNPNCSLIRHTHQRWLSGNGGNHHDEQSNQIKSNEIKLKRWITPAKPHHAGQSSDR